MVNLSEHSAYSLSSVKTRCRSMPECLCSALMSACKSNRQWLCSQLKWLRWALAMCEHTPNVLRVFTIQCWAKTGAYPQFLSTQFSFPASEMCIFVDNSHAWCKDSKFKISHPHEPPKSNGTVLTVTAWSQPTHLLDIANEKQTNKTHFACQ